MRSYLPNTEPLLTPNEVLQLNPLVLAYVGDSVQQLIVRTKLACNSTAKAGQLHKLASMEIKASTQATDMDRLLPYLTDDEQDVYRRTRNTKMNTVAKHSSVADYKKASGFEAIIGYLYLLGRIERLEEIIKLSKEKE